MGSTLVNNTFIFLLFEVKLREMLTNLSISFLEKLTDIVREAIPSESKTSSIDMLLLSTQMSTADSNVNESNTKIDATFFVDMPGPIRDVLRNQTSETPFFQPRDHVIGQQTCRSIDEDPSR